jgi:exodeoxyribonuclease-5
MIANSDDGNQFGSGNLLNDLISYVYDGDNGCKMILLGDTAQLLPVRQEYSPALDAGKLAGYGLTVEQMELTEVVRQATQSGILFNATNLRQTLGKSFSLPIFNLNFPDICSIGGNEILDALYASFAEVGEEQTVIITRSNKRAKRYNLGVRTQVLQKEEMLVAGDLLMITKNNYFYTQTNDGLDFIANGDMARVLRIRKYYDMYNLTFVEVLLNLIDYDTELDCLLILDVLNSETPAEANKIQETLFAAVEADYAHIKNKRERYAKLRQDRFLNALHAKFGYAVTCHKAQGGQWEHVYVDAELFREEQLTPDVIQWLYTAITRARTKLFLINFLPQFFQH